MRVGDRGRPLVAVHSWRAEPNNFMRLSEAMGGQTIYSLLHPDPEFDVMPRRVEGWVDHHEQTLHSIGLEPPYRLIGWSFGGVVAVELARRLQAQGADVDCLGLLDATRPRLVPLATNDFIWHHLAAAAALEPGERSTYLARKTRFLVARRFPRASARAARLLPSSRAYHARRATAIRPPSDPLKVAIHTSYLNYLGAPVTMPVHVYATEESTRSAQGAALRWLPWLHAGYSIVDVPGEHLTMFNRDHITTLAAAVTADLDRLRHRGIDGER
ncbi:MAG: hypothetical protein RI958_142 [Actinomycetota bacterium]